MEKRWISTKERFPRAEYGESQEVLAVNGAGIIHLLYFDGSCWHYPNGNLYQVEPINRNEQRITHWMPLPELPTD